jgi:3'(2'), 5'-bisphosphate nucleotidase
LRILEWVGRNTSMDERVALAMIAAGKAGDAIMKIYSTADFGVEMKSDNSPLTLADRAAHEIIVEHLAETGIPVLSEEGDEEIQFDQRKNWTHLWIVDPLDGTKEFIKRNGEFTVNIALVENGIPVFGVVYAPALDKIYFSVPHDGAYMITGSGNNAKQQSLPAQELPEKFTIVGSRSHSTPETEAYIEEMKAKHGEVDFAASGSSLKFCLVAEGKAHSYPRFAPTMEWDTAAGHAILLAAGGNVMVWPEKTELRYNRAQLRNPFFLATSR